MKRSLFIFILLLAGVVQADRWWADWESQGTDTFEITSVPVTIGTSQKGDSSWTVVRFAESMNGFGRYDGGSYISTIKFNSTGNFVLDLSGPDGIPMNSDDDTLLMMLDSSLWLTDVGAHVYCNQDKIIFRGGTYLLYMEAYANRYYYNDEVYFDYNKPETPDSSVTWVDSTWHPLWPIQYSYYEGWGTHVFVWPDDWIWPGWSSRESKPGGDTSWYAYNDIFYADPVDLPTPDDTTTADSFDQTRYRFYYDTSWWAINDVLYDHPDSIPMTSWDDTTGTYDSADVKEKWMYTPTCIYNTGDSIVFDSINKVVIHGYPMQQGMDCISTYGKAVEIYDGNYYDSCFAFKSRSLFESNVIECKIMNSEALTSEPSDSFHISIENANIVSASHIGIMIHEGNSQGDVKVVGKIKNCKVSIDMRNQRWPYAAGLTSASTTQGYGIFFKFAGPGSYVINDSVLSDNDRGGGRGLALYDIDCTEDSMFIVTGNYMRCNEGRNAEYPTSYGGDVVKIREEFRGIYMYDNVFVMVLGECEDFTGIPLAYSCQGRVFSYEQWCDPEYSTEPYNTTVENNICSLITLVADADNSSAAIRFDKCYVEDTSFHWRNNYVYSEGSFGYDFGTYDGGAAYIKIEGDTIEIDSVDGNPTPYTFNVGFYAFESIENYAVDLTYLGRASDTSVIHLYNGLPPNYGEHEIYMARTPEIYIKGNNGLPVESAVCTLWNNYEDVVFVGTSNSGGLVTSFTVGDSIVPYLFYSYEYDDSTAFNDFVVHAQSGETKGSDAAFTIDDTHDKDTIEVDVVGTGTWGAAPPTAAFSGTPLSGEAPLEVTFTDASTNTPTSWLWDFGDDSTSTDQNPVHTYTGNGTYTVTLTATNDDGEDEEEKVDYVTVSEAEESVVRTIRNMVIKGTVIK